MRRTQWMRSAALLMVAGIALVAAGQAPPATSSTPEAARVLEVRLDDAIYPTQAEFIQDAFDEAARTNARLVLITMNTPGGLDSSMRAIIQKMIASPVPSVVYVSPAGTRAASADGDHGRTSAAFPSVRRTCGSSSPPWRVAPASSWRAHGWAFCAYGPVY